jgi:putative restriction endonuclease
MDTRGDDRGASSLRSRIQDLNVWKRGERRAPHKPLLILYAIGKLKQEVRWISFRDVDADLERLLIEFGPSRKRHHPEYPFWRLQNDGIWTVPHDEPLTRRASNTDPLKSELLEHDIHGGFTGPVWTALKENPSRRHGITRLLLSEHFQPSFHRGLLEAVGLSPALSSAPQRPRDPDFRPSVLQAYSRQCAVCGYDLRLGDKPLGLEAAHIQWHNHGGPDEVTNGIALCALHHKMLDKGALHVSADLRLVVSEAVCGSGAHLGRLRSRHGERVRGPQRAEYRPDEEVVDWHRNEVFREPARA